MYTCTTSLVYILSLTTETNKPRESSKPPKWNKRNLWVQASLFTQTHFEDRSRFTKNYFPKTKLSSETIFFLCDESWMFCSWYKRPFFSSFPFPGEEIFAFRSLSRGKLSKLNFHISPDFPFSSITPRSRNVSFDPRLSNCLKIHVLQKWNIISVNSNRDVLAWTFSLPTKRFSSDFSLGHLSGLGKSLGPREISRASGNLLVARDVHCTTQYIPPLDSLRIQYWAIMRIFVFGGGWGKK